MYQKYLNRALNIGIVLACVLLATGLAQRYYLSKRPAGQTVSLPGVDFSRSSKTLLLFLQQDCESCTKSFPFYRRLLDSFTEPSNVQFVLITPEQPRAAENFFKNERLSFSTILRGEKGLLGVALSPTLILLDSNGIVRGSWIGELQPEGENQIWTMLKTEI